MPSLRRGKVIILLAKMLKKTRKVTLIVGIDFSVFIFILFVYQ